MNVIESTNPQPAFNNKLKPGKLSFKNRKVVFALAFGMAVIIGIFVLWNRIDNSSYSNEPISGYMGSSESAPSDAREIYSTDLKGIESSFGIYRKKDTLFVSMNKKNSDEISIGYSFDPVSVSFVGIKENNLISSAVKQVPGKASITISDPSRILAMFLVNKPSSEMDVQVRDFERQIFRYKFNIDKK